jgi:hypothetical protein
LYGYADVPEPICQNETLSKLHKFVELLHQVPVSV